MDDALARSAPRNDDEDVTAVPEPAEGRIMIGIRYRIRSTNDRRNLVYPFYVIPREGEAT